MAGTRSSAACSEASSSSSPPESPDAYVNPGIITVGGGLLRVNVSLVARNPDYQGTGYVSALRVDRRYASVLGMGRYPMSYHEYNQSIIGDVTAKIMDRVDRCWKIDAYGRIVIDPEPSGATRDGSNSRAASHSTNPTDRRRRDVLHATHHRSDRCREHRLYCRYKVSFGIAETAQFR